MMSKKEIYQLLAERKISKDEAKKLLEEYSEKSEDITFPLSVGQRELYYIYMQNPSETAYNVPVAFDCLYDFDEAELTKALRKTVEEHELLRANVRNKDNEIYFQICNDADITFQVIDKKGYEKEAVVELLKEKAVIPFMLEKEKMLKAYLAYYGDNKKIIMFVFHHIIFDGISLAVFLNDLMGFYENKDAHQLPSKTANKNMDSYGEFVKWQKRRFESSQMEKDEEFWLNKMSGELQHLEIHTGLSGKSSLDSKGNSVSIKLDTSVVKELLELSVENNVNIFHLLMSAYYVLLYRVSGNEDIVIGTPTMIRPNSKFEKTLGYFINTIPLRQKLNKDMSFTELMKDFKNNMLECMDHIYYPYSHIIRSVANQRKATVTGIFDVTFHYQSWMDDIRSSSGKSNTKKLELIPDIHQEGEFPLSLEVYQTADENMELLFKYDTAKYTDSQAEKLIECYTEILRDIVENPDKIITKINLLSVEDYTKQTVEWNNMKAEYPSDKRICDIFDANVEKYAANIAIHDHGKKITYKELYELSNRFALYFHKKGIVRHDYVLLKMQPSYIMVAAILGLMKCGAAYVPLDVDIPKERMEFISEDTNCKFIVCDSSSEEAKNNSFRDLTIIQVDAHINEDADEEFLSTDYDMSDIAYVIYTSGSTGKPKGVEVMHKGLTNVIYGMDHIHHYKESDSILMLTTLCFDIATVELYLPLIKGGSMVVVPSNVKKDGILLKQFMEQNKVDFIQATPATWKMLMLVGWQDKGVKAITAGEALESSLAEKMLDACKEVWNQYGPTENTVYSTVEKVERADYITIGNPVVNTQAYIMDSYQNLMPIGFAGELYVGGNCLAKGYLNRDDLNKKSFVENPLDNTKRLYRTGDLVRYCENGDIEYIGRIDNQIKIRGFRIEIGEIECSIMKDGNIAQCAVVPKKANIDSKMLVAYISLKDKSKAISIEERKKILSKWLHSYMVPATFIELDSFPITLSGKIDRKALENRDDEAAVKKEVHNVGNVEKELVSIVAELIGKSEDRVDVNRNLSEYGFDSILFTAFSTKINETLNLDITPVIFFEYLSIKEISNYLTKEFGVTFAIKHTKEEQRKENVPEAVNTPSSEQWIAIVGLSAKMPSSEDAEELWDNLIKAHDLVSEIPIERWDYNDYYGPGKESKSKWGSFINNIDQFDNEFFGISPREAAYMDPQQRLMLEHVWKCIEDAGYQMSSLARKKVAVMIGASSNDYAETCRDETGYIDPYLATGISKTIISNRISHMFNLYGPSITLDTACSSSLVALDLAVAEIQNGTCESAIVGGVNIILDPHTYIALSKNGMLSSDGKCKVFDDIADGYVRGEGAIALYLKPIKQAERDGDHIYAVIRGSAQNHCGKTSSLTTPSQQAQAELITTALKKADLTPDDISYIEMHGTGTSLGDPIEVEGIKKVFAWYDFDKEREVSNEKKCGLGSIKSNIGHLEGAAGIAGLLKVLLCIKHKELVPNIHYHNLNHNIILENTPLYVVDKAQKWEPLRPGAPLRAGVSAFGFGGQNAHVIVEEYIDKNNLCNNDNKDELIFVFSAKSRYSLSEIVKKFVEWIDSNPEKDPRAVSYQLQNGREEMDYRFAIIAKNLTELKERLQKYADNKQSPFLYVNPDKIIRNRVADDIIIKYCDERNLSELAKLWVNGTKITWEKLWQRTYPKISLPTYQMQKLHHWVFKNIGASNHEIVIDENISTFDQQRYIKHLTGKERYLTDHVIAGQTILPGAIYLEMACEAAARSKNQQSIKVITDVLFRQPILYQNKTENIYIDLEENEGVYYTIYTDNDSQKNCSEGRISFEHEEILQENVPQERIRNRCINLITKEELYSYFKSNQVIYGSTYQSIDKVYYNDQEAFSYISMPEFRKGDLNSYILAPSLLDGALQTIVGINFDKTKKANTFYPYSIGKIEIYNALSEKITCFAKAKNVSEKYMLFDIMIWNADGEISIKINDYMIGKDNRNIELKNNNDDDESDVVAQMHKLLEEGLLTEEEVMLLMEEIE